MSVIDSVFVNEMVYPFLTQMEVFDGTIFTSESHHNFLFVEFDFVPIPPAKPAQKQLGWNFCENALDAFHRNLATFPAV